MNRQKGFAIVEFVIVVVIVAALAGAGYYVWHKRHNNNQPVASTATSSSSNYKSPPTTAPSAPQVNSSSDLNSAMQALNQTDVSAGNTDSGQLSSQASSF